MRHGVLPRDPARRRAVPARRLVRRRGRLLTEARPVAASRPARAGPASLVRHQRHQRPRDPGAGPGRRPAPGRRRPGRAAGAGAVAALGAHRGRRCAPRPPRLRAHLGRRGPTPTRSTSAYSLATTRAALRAPGGRRSAPTATSCCAGLAALAAGAAARPVAGGRVRARPAGVPVHRPGQPAARHGPRSCTTRVPGVRRGVRRGLRRSSTRTSTGRCAR